MINSGLPNGLIGYFNSLFIDFSGQMIDLLVDKNVRLAKIGNHNEDRFRLEEKNTPVIIEESKILKL